MSSTTYTEIAALGSGTAKPMTVAKRLKIIKEYTKPGGRFLDCGCGGGEYVLEILRELKLDAHGLEFDAAKVQQVSEHPVLKDRVSQGDLEAIALPDNGWDYALLNEVLEHVPNDQKALEEIWRVLKPNGLLFIFSPNRWYPFETHGVILKKTDRLLPFWIPLIPYIPLEVGNLFFKYWARNYWQGELRGMVKKAGFQLVDCGYLWQTFEDISGSQPAIIRNAKPAFRAVSNFLEDLPFIKRFGVSQVLICKKPETPIP